MKFAATLTICFVCSLACSPSFAAAEKIYKWKDEKGQIHYSQRPPLNTETEVIKTQTGHSAPVEYKTATETAAKAKVDEKIEMKVAPPKDKARCDNAKGIAETLKNHARIRIKGDDGQFRYLSPEEHQQKTNEANTAIKESCE